MRGFLEGDIVIIKENCTGMKKGEKAKLRYRSYSNPVGVLWATHLSKDNGTGNGCRCEGNWSFVSCDSSYKYENLQSRINALSNGWDKKADDIITEILDNHPKNENSRHYSKKT